VRCLRIVQHVLVAHDATSARPVPAVKGRDRQPSLTAHTSHDVSLPRASQPVGVAGRASRAAASVPTVERREPRP